jgi:ABC-2 type transport system ATP-binding protein
VALSLSGNGAQAAAGVLGDASLVARADDSNRSLEIELARGADPQRLLRRLVDAGVGVERFELVQPSLHRIFLDAVGATGVEEGVTGHG